MRAWLGAHAAGMAAVQAVVFAIAIGIIDALTDAHRSSGSIVVRAAVAGVIFGLLMWGFIVIQRRRTERSAR